MANGDVLESYGVCDECKKPIGVQKRRPISLANQFTRNAILTKPKFRGNLTPTRSEYPCSRGLRHRLHHIHEQHSFSPN
jgi:hypothetical protein